MTTQALAPLLAPALIGDAALFEQALTHGSALPQRTRSGDYQRLEFLGDRVLGLVIAEALYRQHGGADEGALSARQNQLVSRATCAQVARAIGLSPLIRLGKQARDDGARDSDNILGDVVEALIGAVYLDSGMDAARELVLRWWADALAGPEAGGRHPKSRLLEWAAANKRKPPVYVLANRDGPDHAPRFTISVSVAGAGEASATGTSKQDAETRAAAALLDQLEKRP